MPECIVCKGDYGPGTTVCQRCGSDNITWERWQEDEPVEQKGVRGLRHFTEPQCHLPFLIIIVALALGSMGIGGLWEEVNLFTCLLAAAASVVFSLLAFLGVYGKRHELREDHLLERVKTAASKPKKVPEVHLKVELRTVFVLVAVTALVLLLACVLVQFEMPWKISEILFIEEKKLTPTPTTPTLTPTPTPTRPGLRERVKRARSLIFLGGYIGLFPALVYSSSMLLAQAYTRRMNQALPQPIFLQDERLAQIVRKEAEVGLGRIDPKNPSVIDYLGYVKYEQETDPRILRLAPNVDVLTTAAGGGSSSPHIEMWGQAATWIWDELERTEDGGIEMKVARQEMYQLPRQTEGSGIRPNPRVSYVVRADPWGHVIEIKRDEQDQGKAGAF